MYIHVYVCVYPVRGIKLSNIEPTFNTIHLTLSTTPPDMVGIWCGVTAALGVMLIVLTVCLYQVRNGEVSLCWTTCALSLS